MLAALTVRDIVLIEGAALEFAPGLNVLTGETGAGKTILLDALGLAAGGRGGGRAAVRPGAKQGSAAAVFDVAADHPARIILQAGGIAAEGEIVLRRTIAADGRTRAFVNDEPVSVTLLRDVGAALVEVHGQADDRGLFDAATHRTLLDAFGGHGDRADAVSRAFEHFSRARAAAGELRTRVSEAEADAAALREAIDELEALAAREGEEERLSAERALLRNAHRIAEEANAAAEALSGDRGAEALLGTALKHLSRIGTEARAAAANAEDALAQAHAFAEEGRRALADLLRRLNADPAALERVEERLFALRSVARKHNVVPDALPARLDDFKQRLAAIDRGNERLAHAEAAAAEARARYLDAARRLSAARKRAAERLCQAVAGELVPLKLAHAAFRVTLEAVDPETAGPNGLERVAFELATVAGAPFGPLARIASGGELARFSLALKVALAEASPPAALVFDEVDRGVGGAVADSVGQRLQRLAATTQVLLVTHSPQVAARAERHFRIVRTGDTTHVEILGEDARVEEVARMLSGAAVTGEARAAARRLIGEAQGRSQAPARARA